MFRSPTQATPHAEFVTVMAFMMALVAMSTDIMLPALGHINQDLSTSQPNDRQLVIVMLFFGMACGQILWDRFPTVLDEDLPYIPVLWYSWQAV